MIDFTNEESSPEVSNTDMITQTLSPSPGKVPDDDDGGFVSSSIQDTPDSPYKQEMLDSNL
mgnify:CR=1 FL=1